MDAVRKFCSTAPEVDQPDPLETRNPKLQLDVSRRCFRLPQVYLACIGMFPTKLPSRIQKVAFYVNLALMLHLETTQLLYIVENSTDIPKFTMILSTLSTTLQGITKMALLYVNSHRLRVILDQSFFTFWPSDLMGTSIRTSLKFASNFLQFFMICLTVSAVIFAVPFLFNPVIAGVRELPFASWYPFDWRAPGVYECIYTIQAFTNTISITLSILGHDFIFMALATNVVAQFRLLGAVVDHLGSGRDHELDAMLAPLEGVERGTRTSHEERLLGKVIAHHNKLLFICEEMQQIFSPTLFVQLATSTAAICVSSFLLTVVAQVDVSLLYQLTSYCVGHLLQLFMICATGSKMAYQSASFCENAYTCFWYRQKFEKIRKALVLVILRAQRAVRLTALGLFEMNYATFIDVLRLTFSFYTLLARIIEKS